MYTSSEIPGACIPPPYPSQQNVFGSLIVVQYRTLSPKALKMVAAYVAKIGTICSLFQPPKRSCKACAHTH